MRTLLIVALAALLFAGAPLAADAMVFRAELTGDEEVPAPVVTPTRGRAIFMVSRDLSEIRFKLELRRAENLLAVAGAHIHCAPVGQNGPVAAFLAGMVPPNGFDGKIKAEATLNDGSVLSTPCGTTIAELVDAFLAGQAYVNVHSAAYPGGEVRGQIHPAGKDDDSDSDSD